MLTIQKRKTFNFSNSAVNIYCLDINQFLGYIERGIFLGKDHEYLNYFTLHNLAIDFGIEGENWICRIWKDQARVETFGDNSTDEITETIKKYIIKHL